MYPVIACESGFKQFATSTIPLLSRTLDVGIAQINLKSWAKKAEEMGLNIFASTTDNLKMAQYIYSVQGKNAWVCTGIVYSTATSS